MDKKNLIDLLQQISDDCEKAIERGFGPELNMLTIKAQIDEAVKMLEDMDFNEMSYENKHLKEQPEQKTESEIPAEVKDEVIEEKLIESVEELSRDVYSQPEKKQQEISEKVVQQQPVEKKEEYKRLPLQKPNMVQPLKSSSFLAEKPKE